MTFPSRVPGAAPRAAQPSPRRPAPAPARPRHLRVVRSRPAPGRRPPPATIVFASLATAAALFGMVAVQSLAGQTQIKATEIAERIEAKIDRLEALEVQVANLSSLDRVADRAAALGLVAPPAIAFLPASDAANMPADLSAAVVPSYVAPKPARTRAAQSASPSASSRPSPSPANPGASAPRPSTSPGTAPSSQTQGRG